MSMWEIVALPVVDRKRMARAGTDNLAIIAVLMRKARFQTLVAGLLFLAMGGFIALVMVADPQGVGGMIVLGYSPEMAKAFKANPASLTTEQ